MPSTDYHPLFRQFFEAVLETKRAAPTPSHATARRQEADRISNELVHAREDLLTNLNKADRYFSKHGGWGSAEPDPKPAQWDSRTNQYKEWLSSYESVCAALRLGRDFLWNGV